VVVAFPSFCLHRSHQRTRALSVTSPAFSSFTIGQTDSMANCEVRAECWSCTTCSSELWASRHPQCMCLTCAISSELCPHSLRDRTIPRKVYLQVRCPDPRLRGPMPLFHVREVYADGRAHDLGAHLGKEGNGLRHPILFILTY
jgi:hypothetical protein